MASRKAHRLYVAWLQLLTGIYTIWYSFLVIMVALSGKQKRQRITELTHRWSRKLLAPTGLVMHVRGAEHLSGKGDTPLIVMCNHSSAYDIPVSFLALDVDLRMLAKKELFSIPILSSALKAGDFISIDRTNTDQAKRDLKLAEEKLKSGIVVWIAPEGTRSKDGKLRPFKKGGFHLAIDTRAQIVPVVIRGISKILPTRTYDLILNGEVEVVIGEPIDASQFSKDECNKLRDLTREQMHIMLEGEADAE